AGEVDRPEPVDLRHAPAPTGALGDRAPVRHDGEVAAVEVVPELLVDGEQLVGRDPRRVDQGVAGGVRRPADHLAVVEDHHATRQEQAHAVHRNVAVVNDFVPFAPTDAAAWTTAPHGESTKYRR